MVTTAIRIVAVAIAYLLAACAGILLTREAGNVAAVWPANAILIAVLLRSPKRAWGWYAGGVALANTAANMLFGDSFMLALGFAACNLLEILVAVVLVARVCGLPFAFSISRQALCFAILAGGVAPVFGALSGAALITLTLESPFWLVWQTWWIADAMGILIFSPVLLSWNRDSLAALAAPNRISEAAAVLFTLGLTTTLVFTQDRYHLIYLVVPMLLYAAFRLNLFGSAFSGALVSMIAIALTSAGSGPIVHLTTNLYLDVSTPIERIQFLQLFLGVAVLMPLVTAILFDERKRVERSLFEAMDRAQVTLHSIGDAVITTDERGTIKSINPVAEALTGWSGDEARGQPLQRVFCTIEAERRKPVVDPVSQCLNADREVGSATDIILISRTGEEFSIEDSAAPIRGRDGELMGLVLVFRDVTKARRLTEEMHHQATHDALTGLVNRREFEDRLKRVLETSATNRSQNALCYLDLDQFKVINDTSGHTAGDELLRQLAGVFGGYTRKRDTVSRLGGDEFGILMELCTLEEALRVADDLRRVVSNFRFHWQGQGFSVGVSIGLVSVDQNSGTVARVLSAADAACYAAKGQGRNRVHVYQQDDVAIAQLCGEIGWVNRINDALRAGRFRIYSQPITRVAHRPDSAPAPSDDYFELLLRMEDENGTVVSAGDFLPTAERFGLSEKIDRWMVENALGWLAGRPEYLKRLFQCAINLSGYSVASKDFLDFVVAQFEQTNVSPGSICFEVTETAAISNLASARVFMETLRERGCRFALDDFGSGLSSFAYLKNLPVDCLKIDGAFVKDIVRDPIDLAMVRSIAEVAAVMGLETVAEFVEDEPILEKIAEIGVDYAQGYAVGEPRLIRTIATLRAGQLRPLREAGVGRDSTPTG